MPEIEIGKVVHYFDKISVAAVSITDGELRIGDTIRIKGHTSDISTQIDSMQVEHQSVSVAKKGDDVGIKVPGRVRVNDAVYKVIA